MHNILASLRKNIKKSRWLVVKILLRSVMLNFVFPGPALASNIEKIILCFLRVFFERLSFSFHGFLCLNPFGELILVIFFSLFACM